MATAGASTVVILCIMPTPGSSGRPPTASHRSHRSPECIRRGALLRPSGPKTRGSPSPPGGRRESSGFSDRREANAKLSLMGDSDTPGKLAHLDRLDDLEICNVDDGDVVRYAVGREKIFFVRGKRHMPDALAHEEIFLDLVRRTVDHGNAVGRTERHETCLAVPGNADPDRPNGLLAQPRNIEGNLLLHLVFRGIDDAHGAADFG